MSRLKEFVLLNILFPLGDKIMGACAMQWYKKIIQMNQWSKQEITDWQNNELHRFVKHAYDHTVYYRELFDSLKLTPDDIRCKEDLRKIPLMTKEVVNEHYNELIPDNLNQFRYRLTRSGGTTGAPVQYYCDENVWGYVTAARIYHWKKTSYRYGDAFIALGSASLFSQKPSFARRIYDRMRNEHQLNCGNLTDENCSKDSEYIKAHNIHVNDRYHAPTH